MSTRKVAIDGPSGAGKSTIARRVASDVGFRYVDTGAIYRAVGLYTLTRPLELHKMDIEIGYDGAGRQITRLNGEDVTDAIRRHEVSKAASDVSALPQVREFLLQRQRDAARRHDVIMDGRDIGTVVLPDADLKIFLTASPRERARRRWEEMTARGETMDYRSVLRDMENRDESDARRASAPLRPAPDAVIVDTTGNEWERSVAIIREIVTERLGL
ncbi:MAG: (d)CMP kinase [Oscillospiraceae bacterium]|nr:(d)CMP kinase [Oscillospiraceae bacterium]